MTVEYLMMCGMEWVLDGWEPVRCRSPEYISGFLVTGHQPMLAKVDIDVNVGDHVVVDI